MRLASMLFVAASLACTSVLPFVTPSLAVEVTSISGTFNGCDWDKTYELLNGRTLVCRCYRYHYAYAPKVVIIDSGTVLIDDEEYSAWVR